MFVIIFQMTSARPFSYLQMIKETSEEWKIEIINVFRCLDTESTGWLPREDALHVLSLLGMGNEARFPVSRKQVSIKMVLEAVQDERERNIDPARRWRYIFYLIADPETKTITKERIREFFTMFGHTPEEKFCDDFIDEFDRTHLEKSEITVDDWLMFCRIHRLPF